ncbi:MAG: formylglycine-generating enzyme family protein [Kiritimatiellae bacterium]|nr:formylglycine-generating enzyme family protein [Kiritimatiellia bacterium]
MNVKKLIAVAAVAASAMAANAASVTIDSVAQRWPWNNKVDITYTVTDGQNHAAGVYCGIEFNVSVPGYGDILVHGYSLGASAEGDGNGKQHTVTWTAPSGLKSTDCTISATLFTTNVPSGNDYMIVNLSSGEVYYEGLMTTQDASNSRYNVAEYKTSKLVLRKVPKWADHGDLPNAGALTALGGYPTGDNVNYSSTNSRKNWQTAKDYYIGMFLVTQKQYQDIYGSNPSQMTRAKTGDVVGHRPVERLHWQTVRGNIQSTDSMSASSSGTFFQRLNFKTGLYFDLPTEVMFEIAQRAGATTVYSWGDSSDDLPNYCVCASNYGGTVQNAPGDYTCAVGSFLPNNWGIYDTAGNVWEWCRDRNAAANKVASGNMANNADAFTPSSSGSYYIGRGFGGASSSQTDQGFRASYRYSSSSSAGWNRGFRVSHVVED